MNAVEVAKLEMFKLLDKFCKSLVERGLTRDEVEAVLTIDRYEVKDTVHEAFSD